MRAQAFTGLPRAFARGVREGGADFRRWDTLGELPLPVPPVWEQHAIADFLDAELAHTDALIAKKRHLIRVLDERVQSVVNEPFNQHLRYGVDGRPIGLEQMPCVRLGQLASIQTGVTVDEGREPGPTAVTLPYLRVANVQDGSLDLSELKEVAVPISLAKRCRLRRGDVLMTEGGDPDKLGRGAVWEGIVTDCLHQNHVFALRPGRSLVPEYLALVTRTSYARAYFEMTASKTTGIASTSTTKIASFRVPIAKIEEQQRIVDRVAECLAPVLDATQKVRRQIELLAEHRKALITAAVTGNQLRGVAA